MKCIACGIELSGGLDTFGELGTEMCQSCCLGFADDYDIAEQNAALREAMDSEARDNHLAAQDAIEACNYESLWGDTHVDDRDEDTAVDILESNGYAWAKSGWYKKDEHLAAIGRIVGEENRKRISEWESGLPIKGTTP